MPLASPGFPYHCQKYTRTMGIRMARKKRRVPIVSLIYKLDRLLPFSTRRKLKWYLDLEWSFDRLAMEYSFHHYAPKDHPHRRSANAFLLRQLRPGMEVLDLGCNRGDMAVVLADHVTRVVGIDHNDSAIQDARNRHQRPNLTFNIGRAACRERGEVEEIAGT